MIHNGIEYAIMQLISENYHVLKYGLKRSNDEIHKIFKSWNEGLLESYLVEISRDIFKAKDSETGNDLIDVILDKAKQKGTGKWTSQSAMDFGVSIPTIDSSVSMRIISSFKDLRTKGENIFGNKAKIYMKRPILLMIMKIGSLCFFTLLFSKEVVIGTMYVFIQ